MNLPTTSQPLLCPLVFSVTGHRDIPDVDIPKLSEEIRSFVQSYASKFSSTPIQLLTPLAEGADRIAAKVFLDEGHEIIAVLPFEPEEYQTDFEAEESRQEFWDLLGRSAGKLVVETAQSTLDNLSGRDVGYFEAGRFVALHSAIMIAAWDGGKAKSAAGTAAIVALISPGLDAIAAGVPEALAGISKADERNVYHIPVRRKRAMEVNNDQLYRGNWLNDLAETETTGFERLDVYNHSLQKLFKQSSPVPEVGKIAESLLGDWGRSSVERLSQPSLITFASADALANRYATITRKHFSLLYWSYFLAGIFALLYGTAVEKDWMIGLFMLLLGLLQIPIWLFKRYKVQEYHLNFRALAESLRVHNYWSAAGIDDEVADHFLERTKDEDIWIRQVLRHCSLRDLLDHETEHKPTATSTKDALNAVTKHWVNGQAGFYKSRSAKMTRDRISKERLAQILVFIGIALLMVEALFRMSLRFFPDSYIVEACASTAESGMAWMESRIAWFPETTSQLNRKHPLLMIPAGLCLAFAGFLANYNAKQQVVELSKHYDRSARVFKNSSRILELADSNNDLETARSELRSLGVEALNENGIWMLLHQNRPLNPT